MPVLVTRKYEEDRSQIKVLSTGQYNCYHQHNIFPILSQWQLLVAMVTIVLARHASKTTAIYPLPNDTTHEILTRLASWH